MSERSASIDLTRTGAGRADGDRPPLLAVDDLAIAYGGPRGTEVVHGVDLRLAHGETLALVGQSGSGKSTIARAVSGLLPEGGRITRGAVHLDGVDVTRFRARDWRALRGTTVGWVPQDPLSSLDPLQRIGGQLIEAIRVGERGTRGPHAGSGTPRAARLDRAALRRRATELLDRVGIHEPESRLRSYPHELSGGQLQRVLIAIAIAADPAFLIADEPTSALDVTVQKRILDLIDELRRERGLGVLFITHDLALASERSDHVAVLRDGVLLENRPVEHVIAEPEHEYTVQLFSDVPAAAPQRYAHLRVVDPDEAGTVVHVRELGKVFPARGSSASVTALRDVSLDVIEGSVHAIVGESGSGKTTLARIVAGLTPHTSGSVSVLGRPLPAQPERWNRRAHELQLVYQNPLAAVDPRFRVEQIVAEPLAITLAPDARPPRAERSALVRAALDAVALPSTLLTKRAHELSGGQRQRVALARALVAAPRILVLDEPTSALDVTVQSQIVELLFDLRRERGLTYVFISHDLGLVEQIADHVSVLQHGRLVETGAARDLFRDPQHEYTQRLLEAVPGRALFGTGAARPAEPGALTASAPASRPA